MLWRMKLKNWKGKIFFWSVKMNGGLILKKEHVTQMTVYGLLLKNRRKITNLKDDRFLWTKKVSKHNGFALSESHLHQMKIKSSVSVFLKKCDSKICKFSSKICKIWNIFLVNLEEHFILVSWELEYNSSNGIHVWIICMVFTRQTISNII